VGHVISFFQALILETPGDVVLRRLAFVKWLDEYAPDHRESAGV
jgi:hypothetical protein